jgi:1-acyl-sn-glycerol-3-phosphate acyltransferase
MNYNEILSPDRARVIKNIEEALSENDTFRKVETSDPEPDDADIERVIVPFDNKRTSPVSRAKAFAARLVAEAITKKVNGDTEIVGLENALGIEGGAIITTNHYNPTDSTPIRILARKLGKKKRLHIVVQERNIFMTGLFGFLMKNCNTHPVSKKARYMAKNLKPALDSILRGGGLVLIYPEQEMWYNYKKPRPLRDGAYHYASEFSVPIIPTFTEMITLKGERDPDGALPVKHVLHVLPPIYPNKELSVREDRERMMAIDLQAKIRTYEECYGIPYSSTFCPERDVAGITPDL